MMPKFLLCLSQDLAAAYGISINRRFSHMDNSVKELDFVSLQRRFDDICEDVNVNRKAVALALKSGRKVFIMPEENFDNISHFIIKKTNARSLI